MDENVMQILGLLVIPIITALFATIIALRALSHSKTANTRAKESIIESEKANILAEKAITESETANTLSKEANELSEKAFDESKKAKYEAKRPKPDAISIKISPANLKVFRGSKASRFIDEPDISNFLDIEKILDPNIFQKSTVFDYDGKKYMLINTLPKDVSKTILLEQIVLAFNVIEVEISLGSRISEIKIEKAYTMIDHKSPFTDVEVLDVKFPIGHNQVTLTMPFAYACFNHNIKTLDIERINNLKKSGNTEEINLLEQKVESALLGFYETAFLIRCKTTDDEVGAEGFLYSFLIHTKYGKIEVEKIHDGDYLFNKKAAEAESRSGRKIVQHSID
ncbi:MAG: hypothetical protein FWC91_09515 [Defluviitaleaceae bacterium]|nr:hypothetical protein [Defluviitaleaceae bacterium]